MKLRTIMGFGVAALAIAAAGLSFWAWQQSKSYPMTDAATVDAPVVKISAVVPGLVIEVAVENNQYVQAGDLLFRLDPELYDLQLQQAKAALATAESELRQGERNLALEQSNADVAAGQIDRTTANLALAQHTLDRLEPLLEEGYVTAQQVETARTAVRDAEVSLEQAQSHASGTVAFVGTLDTRRAQVDTARAAVAIAERNRRHTEIHAPRAGYITGLTLTVGEFVVSATPLFSLIDDNDWRVTALFRETDLPNISVGNRARIFLFGAPSTPVSGHVASVGWGIRSTDEAHLLGLPLVANKLDWVRAARRFPVEIELADPPKDLVRLGASASVRILGAETDKAQ